MKKINISLILMIVLILSQDLFADIAATRHEGIRIIPLNNEDVAMEKEEVIIYETNKKDRYFNNYNYWFNVETKFFMKNTSNKTLKVKIGFPGRYNAGKHLYKNFKDEYSQYYKKLFEFKVKINGKELKYIENFDGDFGYGWNVEFEPGITIIEVDYSIKTSNSYDAIFQNIYYIIDTGRFWKGKIKDAIIEVSFLEDLKNRKISIEPKKYKIEGNTIKWHFKNLEPSRKDNIRVQFISINDFNKLIKLDTSKYKIKKFTKELRFVNHIYNFGLHRGRKLYFYRNLLTVSKDIFENEVLKYLDKKERNELLKYYKLVSDYYELREVYIKELDDIRLEHDLEKKLRKIFEKTNLNFYVSGDNHFEKAKRILEKYIENSSKNELVWHLYLFNLKKMFVFDEYIKEQERKISKKALKICGRNKIINFWLAKHYKEFRKLPKVELEINRIDNKKDLYLEISYEGRSGPKVKISEDEKNKIMKCYKVKKSYREKGIYHEKDGERIEISYHWKLEEKILKSKKSKREVIGILSNIKSFYERYYDRKIKKWHLENLGFIDL